VNILFLSTWFPCPPDNGSKMRVYYLLRALSARHRVTLLSFAFAGAQPPAAAAGFPWAEAEVVARNPFVRSRAAHALRFLSPTPIVARPLPQMQQAAHRLLQRRAYDVIIASTEVTAVYALSAGQTCARILEEHNSLSRQMWDRHRQETHPLRRLSHWVAWHKARAYEAWLFRRFDLCTVVSEQDRGASLRWLYGYRGPLEVVPNGVDCQVNRPGIAPKQPHTLIYNGALTYSANFDAMRYFLAEIYPSIRREEPRVSLTITGSTAGVALERLGLDPSVRLSGYVEDVRPLVGASTVCVVPLRAGGGTRSVRR
jgi:glycosyltransferase involved in cell wall biosynthesis